MFLDVFLVFFFSVEKWKSIRVYLVGKSLIIALDKIGIWIDIFFISSTKLILVLIRSAVVMDFIMGTTMYVLWRKTKIFSTLLFTRSIILRAIRHQGPVIQN